MCPFCLFGKSSTVLLYSDFIRRFRIGKRIRCAMAVRAYIVLVLNINNIRLRVDVPYEVYMNFHHIQTSVLIFYRIQEINLCFMYTHVYCRINVTRTRYFRSYQCNTYTFIYSADTTVFAFILNILYDIINVFALYH